MCAVQSGYNAKYIKAALSEIEGVKKAKKVIDLGCGSGLFMLNLAKENPDMNLVLYDMPPMRPIIEQSIQLTGMQERTSIMCGDFTKEEIGTGYDVIFSSNSVYSAKGCIDEFMKKIYEYIQPVQVFGKSFGLGSPYLMKRKLRKCALAHNINISINDTKKFRKFNYLVEFMNSALEKDIPVMMLIGYNGKNMEVYYEDGRITKGEFKYHWITITELIVDYEVEEAIIRCSTWGRSAYISLKDFMKFEPLCRGLLYIS